MFRKIILFLLLCLPSFLRADKKPLDHSVYDQWKSLNETAISDDGKFITYQIKPQRGDSRLIIENRNTDKKIIIERGKNSSLCNDKYAVCIIAAPYAETRMAKIKKKKVMPKDSLAVITLDNGNIQTIADVSSFKAGSKGSSLIAFTCEITPNNRTTKVDTAQSEVNGKRKAIIQKKGLAKKSKALIVMNLLSGRQDTLPYIDTYQLNETGTDLAAITKKYDTIPAQVYRYNSKQGCFESIHRGLPFYSQLSFNKKGNLLAFVGSADTSILTTRRCELFLLKDKQKKAQKLVSLHSAGLPENFYVSEYQPASFSKNGERIFFGTAPVRQLKDTTIIESETAKLDLWSYDAPQIPPTQLKRKERDLRRTYLAVVNLNQSDKIVQLGDKRLRTIMTASDGDARYAIAMDDTDYELDEQWLGPCAPTDLYALDTKTGERTLVEKELYGYPQISPSGKYLFWFDMKTKRFHSYDLFKKKNNLIPTDPSIHYYDEEYDEPSEPREYGIASWLADDKGVIINGQYDLWLFDPDGIKQPVNLTNGFGQQNQIVFRHQKLIREKRFYNPKEVMMLQALNKKTKERGFFSLQLNNHRLNKLTLGKYCFSNVAKAKGADVFIFARGSFNQAIDLYVTPDHWKTEKRISDINPQMNDYLWGTPELFYWKTFSGKDAEGVVYKPENFNPEKKYPVLIYFYEKLSDECYNYTSPAPSRSVINIPFFTSRGYIVFTPDICYKPGQPGENAYDYVVSGAQALAKNSWVNEKKMGIQGQSWGGYQVAYLITRTNMFAAAEAGAPVSNMTSAYGGIRWSTGVSRQFQYEKTQSRIGKDLWNGFDLYIKNSPVFFADRVNTPLLIMHNDNDGAVPWYQGIEYFMDLRRLKKKVWMIQYNGEEHNLNNRSNMIDLSKRLQQFFDYYLKDEPMPAWMKTGIPATRKGLYFGFEDAK